MSRKHVLAAVLAAGAIAPATASAAPPAPTFADHAIIARDIIPSGEPGDVPPPAGADQQAQMYNALTPLFNHVTKSDLLADFKADPIGAQGLSASAKETPRAGVTIYRDSFDVPHIFGTTRDDVTWGAGYVLVQDRGLLLQQARYDSRVAAIDAPGLSALGLISGLENFKPTAQTETRDRQADQGAARPRRRGSRRAARHRRLPRRHQRRVQGRRLDRRSVHAQRHLRAQRAQGSVRRRGRRRRGCPLRVPDCAATQVRRQEGPWRVGRPARGQRPRGARERPRQSALPGAAEERQRQRQPRPGQHDFGCDQGAGRLRAARTRQQRADGVRCSIRDPSPDHGRRPADRLLLPGPDDGGGPGGPGHQPARSDRGAVPGVRLHRTITGRGVVADVGRP